MSKRKRSSPVEDATKHILSGKDKPCFEERFINSQKGRGVFASMSIDKGCFILEYRGELLSKEESQIRQNRYNETENTFLFDFDWNGRQWSIDASKEDGSLGRLVNDKYKTSNCKMKKIGIEGKPHLCLFSIKDIASGEELTYNYGNSNWPWRTLMNRAAPRSEENTPSEEGSCLPTKMNRSPKPTEQIGSHLSEPRPSNSDQCTDRNSDHSSTASDTTENHSQVNRAVPRCEENTPSEEGSCLPTKMNRSPKPTEQIGSHLSEPRPSNSDQCTDRNSDHSSTASDTTENHSQVNRAVPRCEENTPSEEGSCLPTKMNRSPKPTEQIGSHLSEPRPSNSDQCTDRNSDHSSTASDTTENHSQVNRAVPRCEENTPSEEGSCLPTKMNRSPKPTEQIGSHLSEPRPSNSDQCTDRNSDHSSTASDTTENHSQVNRAVPRCEENTPSEEGSCLPTKMNRSPKPTEQIGSHLSEPRPSNSDQCTDRNSDHSSTASDTTENHSQVNRAVPRCEENTPSEEGSCLPTKMNRSPKPTEQIGSHLSEPRPSNSDQCTDRNSDHSSTASDTTENHSQAQKSVSKGRG